MIAEHGRKKAGGLVFRARSLRESYSGALWKLRESKGAPCARNRACPHLLALRSGVHSRHGLRKQQLRHEATGEDCRRTRWRMDGALLNPDRRHSDPYDPPRARRPKRSAISLAKRKVWRRISSRLLPG